MEEYQEKYETLLEEKKKIELEFGLARRRFKELYVGCENQLNNEKENSRQLEIQVKELTRQVDHYKAEMEGVRIAAKISEEAKQEEYANIRTKHEEEIASMQHIWKEASMDNQNRLANEFEEERKKLLNANSKLEQKIRQIEEVGHSSNQNRGTPSDSIVSMMTNAFGSRKSANQNPKGQDMPLSLENTQKMVQQDITAWKSVVEPLETELESLKKQVIDLTVQLKEAQGGKKDKIFEKELSEAQKYFESEKSARTDLEMYVAVLNTQKTVLQEDSDKLKTELHNVCRLFEQEKMSHNELKQTWKLANEQFLTQQKKLVAELEVTQQLMSPEQIEQLSKAKCINSSSVISTAIEHPIQVIDSSKSGNNQPSNNLIEFDSSDLVDDNDKSEVESKDDSFSAVLPELFQANNLNELVEDEGVKGHPSLSDSEDEIHEQGIHIDEMKERDIAERGDGDINADDSLFLINKVSLAESSLTQIDESLAFIRNLNISKEDNIEDKHSSDDFVLNNSTSDFSKTCLMCQNYEKQLQRLQKELMVLKEIEQNKLDDIKSLQGQLNSEKDNVSALEKNIETISSDNKTQLCIYERNQLEVDKQVMVLKNQFQEFQLNILMEMRKISEINDDQNL